MLSSLFPFLNSFLLTVGSGPLTPPSGTGSSGYSAYVPYDPNLILKALSVLRANLGSGINIAFWIFIMITGIYAVFNIVSAIGK